MTSVTPHRTYEILEVAQLTGLEPARLRVWERRYAVVRPHRQKNRYRAYSGEQVALLRAYARLCAAGERIGDLVKEPRDQIIARAEQATLRESPVAALLDAIRRLDRDRSIALLGAERSSRTPVEFGRAIVLPLAELIGDQWALGRLTIAAEHLASEVVVPALKAELTHQPGKGPLLLGACFPGERHEWGFLVTLIELREHGWRTEYLGADLPFDEVAEAAWTLSPQVVALSSADPDNVQARLRELRGLPRLLPPGAMVVIGGEGALANLARLHRARLRVGMDEMPAPVIVRPSRHAAGAA
ncbi:MAG: MerR family transcriptional regulator [Gemmatimonadales bacterium]|nr:MAG: MerR family transcriptional regulator [Gemmatimonadales bacterium]